MFKYRDPIRAVWLGLEVILDLPGKLSKRIAYIWPRGLSRDTGLGHLNSSAMPTVRASRLPSASLSLDVTW